MKLKNKLVIKTAAFMACASVIFSSTPARRTAAETVSMILVYDGEPHTYTAGPARLVVNGLEAGGLAMPPIILNDYMLVPAREIFEQLNAVVYWNSLMQEVYISYYETFILLRINDINAEINGRTVQMPVPAKIINDKTMIPLRFVADNLNLLVYWDDQSRTAYVDDLNIYGSEPGYVSQSTESESPSEQPGQPSPSQPSPEQSGRQEDVSASILSNIQSSDSAGPIPAKDVSVSDITPESHGDTSIIDIGLPQNNGNIFTIRASSAISKVEKHQLPDNRMYLDIYDAVLNLSAATYPLADNPSVVSVRAAQNQSKPVMITRVVFDLKDGAEYSVSISQDRKEIYVGFAKNDIYNMNLVTNGSMDSLVIYGGTTPSVSVIPLSNPERLVIDIPFARISGIASQSSLAGRFVTGAVPEQLDANTARITLSLSESVMHDIKTDNNTVTISLSSRTYQNIEYDINRNRLYIRKNPSYPLDTRSFVHIDDYSNFTYTISLGGDYSGYLGNGDLTIRDNYLNSAHIRTAGGATKLELNETGIFAYNVYEDADFIYIEPVHPKQKYSKIVVIDPGHGGGHQGTSGFGLIEKELNLDIAKRLMALFEQDPNIKAYATRTSDVNPDLEERGEFGTNIGDLFVSIHNNFAELKAGTGIPNPEPNGTETHYFPHDNDAALGMSSEQTAEIIQRYVANGLGSNNRGIKQTRFIVLNTARVPAVLVEVGYLSNQADSAKLNTTSYRDSVAQALYRGITEVFGVYTPRR